jgi:hypothetical protein
MPARQHLCADTRRCDPNKLQQGQASQSGQRCNAPVSDVLPHIAHHDAGQPPQLCQGLHVLITQLLLCIKVQASEAAS